VGKKPGPKKEALSKQLLNLKEKTSWSWERMCQEFHRLMGAQGPSHTTLIRYALENVKRRNVVTEQYVREAIDKVAVELVRKELSESETQRKRVLKELRQTEIRFHDLVENARDVIHRYRLVPTPGMEYISPSVTDVLGYTPEEFYADPDLPFKIVHPDDRRRFEKIMRGEGFEEPRILRYMHKNGSLIWIERVAVAIHDEAGNLVAMEGISRDITERKRVEKKLRENEELLRQITENIQEVFFVVEHKDYRILYVSPSYEEIWGQTCESLLKSPTAWVEAIIPEDRERVSVALDNQQRTGKFNEEFRIVRPDKSIRWVHDRVFPIRNAQGEIYRLVGIALDITERKRMEEALRETEERFRSLVEHTTDILWELDQEGAYTYVSPNVQDILGYSPEQLIGKTPFEFMPEEEAERVGQTFAQIVQKGRSFTSLQHQALCESGKMILLECSGVPITTGKGTVQGYRGIDRDITKRAEV
jgi:PAS domain S-box-containing protein